MANGPIRKAQSAVLAEINALARRAAGVLEEGLDEFQQVLESHEKKVKNVAQINYVN